MFRTDAIRLNLFCEQLHSDLDAGKKSYEASLNVVVTHLQLFFVVQ